MKRLIIVSIITICLLGFSNISTGTEVKEKYCPVKYYLKAKNVNECFKCHTEIDFKLKKINPLNEYVLPDIAGIKIFNDKANNEKLTVYYTLSSIDDFAVHGIFHWMEWHPEIKNMIIEIQSPGGSLLEAWRIIGIIEGWKALNPDNIIETRVNGLAASAGLLIFMSGNIRSVSPTAELMWHELSITSYGYHRSTPSNANEKAKVLKHLQSTATKYISERCNLTKEELSNDIKNNKEFWINGEEAKKNGIATKLLW